MSEQSGVPNWAGRVAFLLSFLLAATLADLPPAPAPAAQAKPVAPRPAVQCPDERADRVSAATAARLCRGKVEVAGLRDETTTVYAEPDGTFTAEITRAPSDEVTAGRAGARPTLDFGSPGFLRGARVTAATLHLRPRTTEACAPGRWRAETPKKVRTGTSAGCVDGWDSAAVTPVFQAAARGGGPARVVLAADQATPATFAGAGDDAPYVTLAFNGLPWVVGQSSAPTVPCGLGTRRPHLSSATPTLYTTIADPDGGTLRAIVEVWPVGGSAAVFTHETPAAPSGTVVAAPVPAGRLTEGGHYSWRTTATDGAATSADGRNAGSWSGWCEFTVDSRAPGAPFVSSAQYPDDDQWHGAFGQAGSFTFTPPAGTTDVTGYQYQLDTAATATTVDATGAITVSITPGEDGVRTLTVRAKDRAGNLSNPSTHRFKVGRAGLTLPAPGANVVKRMKLAIEGDATYTRVRFQYRRGPGSPEQDVPTANMTTGTGAAVTAFPTALTGLGGYAVWNAVDTLGPVGGVVQVRGVLYPASGDTGYQTQWITVNVDPAGDGAATDDIAPGKVNLLTGDLTTEATDADEFGLTATRTASSRGAADGWIPQGERLTPAQQQIADLSAVAAAPGLSGVARVTDRGQSTSTDALELSALGGGTDTYASVGGDGGALRLGMKPGRRYRMTGWVWVPAGAPAGVYPGRELRIVGITRNPAGHALTTSARATVTNAWQQLSVDLAVPQDATEAWFRLYLGFAGAGKKVYWDNLSVRELVAPFGPQWRGAVSDEAAETPYTTLEFPTPDLAKINTGEGEPLTFARSQAGGFFPQPGAETLTLSAVDANTYRLTDVDGTVVTFARQPGSAAFPVATTTTPGTETAIRYTYDVTDNRTLVKRVINPTAAGVGDCTTPIPARGCQVLEYDYATATTATADALGDVKDLVRAVKVWAWNQGAARSVDTEVARYLYDPAGRLRETWDPRTTWRYNAALGATATGGTPCAATQDAAKAVNGTTTGGGEDKWCSTAAAPSLRVDLGSVRPVTTVAVHHAGSGGEQVDWNTRGYSIKLSTDGTNWTTAATVTGNTSNVSTHTVPTTPARYLRLDITNATQAGGGAARIYELEAYVPSGPGVPLRTTYAYDTAGRVTTVTPPGELPWHADYGDVDVDAARLRWDLDEGAGTSAADTSGAGRTGTMSTDVLWGAGNNAGYHRDTGAQFGGFTGNQLTAAGPAVNTSQSFTVSAWVNLTDPAGWRTAVSQDGSTSTGFVLGRDHAADRWQFAMTSADTSEPVIRRAHSTGPPTAGSWTHLTGVHDATAKELRLYVNGVLQQTTPHTGAWNAAGPFALGRLRWKGAAADWWAGGIDDVRAYQKALTPQQVAILAGDEHPGKLQQIRRAALQPGSRATTDGEVATRIVYHVPLTRTAGGPHAMDHAAISTWAQRDLPTDATAVFPTDQDPSVVLATPAAPGPDGYRLAEVHYLNAGGQEVNTATPGGDIDTQEYDRFGNVIRTLEAGNRALALGAVPDAARRIAQLNLPADTAERARLMSTQHTYGADGIDLKETLGPLRRSTVTAAVSDPSGARPPIPAGAEVVGRVHTVRAYDQGRPDGATYHLETAESVGLAIGGYPDADVRTERTGYDPEQGGASGWALKKPTRTVTDAQPGGLARTTVTVYDPAGRVVRILEPGTTGSDARTREVVHYTAGANATDAACGSRPEWAGKECVTRAAGAVTGHDPARMTGTLPVRRVERYSTFGQEETVTETSGGRTRRTETTYDDLDRVSSTLVTADDGTTATAPATTRYDQATGRAVATNAGGTEITMAYDRLGRRVDYTDADGASTVTQYDRHDKPVRVTDPHGTTTYAYDRTVEPRGQLTSVTDPVAGTFTARYAPDGQLVKVTYPGGLTRTDTLDANLTATQRSYTRDADGAVIFAESVVEDTHSRWTRHSYTGGQKDFTYDNGGRLTGVRHDRAGGCVVRGYAYDIRADRTGRTERECDATGEPDRRVTHAYDSAGRLTDAGYTYDAFGRTTATPGGTRLAYHADDLTQRQTTAQARQTYTLDPARRFRGITVEKADGTGWSPESAVTNHYGDESDEPRWTADGDGVTRNVNGPDGDLAALTAASGSVRLQLVNLHGDVAATINAGSATPEILDYDEYGGPVDGQAGRRYGWLGGKQRAADGLGGTVLMGVRLYRPDLGRFLSVDPVYGGSCNGYEYVCADPVNSTDLDGKRRVKRRVPARAVRRSPARVRQQPRPPLCIGRIGVQNPRVRARCAPQQNYLGRHIGNCLRGAFAGGAAKVVERKTEGQKVTRRGGLAWVLAGCVGTVIARW